MLVFIRPIGVVSRGWKRGRLMTNEKRINEIRRERKRWRTLVAQMLIWDCRRRRRGREIRHAIVRDSGRRRIEDGHFSTHIVTVRWWVAICIMRYIIWGLLGIICWVVWRNWGIWRQMWSRLIVMLSKAACWRRRELIIGEISTT